MGWFDDDNNSTFDGWRDGMMGRYPQNYDNFYLTGWHQGQSDRDEENDRYKSLFSSDDGNDPWKW